MISLCEVVRSKVNRGHYDNLAKEITTLPPALFDWKCPRKTSQGDFEAVSDDDMLGDKAPEVPKRLGTNDIKNILYSMGPGAVV